MFDLILRLLPWVYSGSVVIMLGIQILHMVNHGTKEIGLAEECICLILAPIILLMMLADMLFYIEYEGEEEDEGEEDDDKE